MLLAGYAATTVLGVADELGKSRSVEAQLRGQMCDAIRSAEAEAHRKVEDSYQEASFAGEQGGPAAASGKGSTRKPLAVDTRPARSSRRNQRS